MLIPPFAGVGLKAFDKAGEDITAQLFVPSGFMKVDGDYTARPYAEWCAERLAEDLPDTRPTATSSRSVSPSRRRI